MALVLVVPAVAVHDPPAIPDLLPTPAFVPAPLPVGFTNIPLNAAPSRDSAVMQDLGISVPDRTVIMDIVGPSQSLQAVIDAASPGDTIVLEPGIYREHNLTVTKELYFMANISAGGDRNNTIIDAQGADRIFNVSGTPTFLLQNLTLRNGRVAGDGGAIYIDGGTIVLVSSTIENCSADGDGGAIYALPAASPFGSVFLVYSSITRCSSGSAGGAVAAIGANILVFDSTISFCSAMGGGAIAASSGSVLLAYSRIDSCTASIIGGGIYEQGGVVLGQDSSFSNCSATGLAGGGIFATGSSVQLLGTSFTDCSAGTWGGAVETYGIIVVDSGEFTRCTAFDGGALDFYDQGAVISRSNFTDCTAVQDGGAVWSDSGQVVAATSRFTNCHAGDRGGALALYGPDNEGIIISSDFTGCSAGTGGAVFTEVPVELHYSRVYGCDAGTAFWNDNTTITANVRDTWWGTNAAPSGSIHGNVSYSPWLVLGITVSPRSILSGHAAAVQTNLTWDSSGANTTTSGYYVPDGILTTYTVSGSGTVNPPMALTREGIAGTYYTGGATGTNGVCGTVDGQTVCTPVEVSYPPATIGPTNDDDALPGGVTPSATGTGSTVIPMTVTVNIAGGTAAGRAMVTGTNLAGLVVTGTVQRGPGINQTAPPGIVYQYLSLEPAGYTGISRAVINFTVPQSWLDENRVPPGGVVLYHLTANGWEALLTTALQAKDGQVFFSGQSPGLSLFAITGTPAAPAQGTSLPVPTDLAGPAKVPEPVQTSARQVPAITETTAVPPGAGAPAGISGLPVMPALLGVCLIGLLGGGGLLARRWWVRRQNPALFREYE